MSQNLVAFTGGGWNAMSGHSGWIGAALTSGKHVQDSSLTLDQLFADTQSAAGNSGGSWFLSMLAYSDDFAVNLSTAPDQWFDTGYFADQKNIFSSAESNTNWPAIIDQACDLLVTTTFNDILETLGATYEGNNLFGALDSFLDEINNINFPGIGDLVTDIKNGLTSLTKDLKEETIKRLGLEEAIQSAIKKGLKANNFVESLFALVVNPYAATGDILNWYDSVKNTAFKSYNATETLNKLASDATRLSWAGDKNLLFPITASGLPINVGTQNNVRLEASLTPTASSKLPTDSAYLLPLTAKISTNEENSISTIEFPEKNLAYAGTLFQESSNIPTASQPIPIGFPLPSELTILETVTASGSFAGEFAIPDAIKSFVTSTISSVDTAIETAKGYAASAIQEIPQQIISEINSSADQFFEGLKKSTDTGNFITNGINEASNFLVEGAEELFDALLSRVDTQPFSDVALSISNNIFNTVETTFKRSTNFSDHLYNFLSDFTTGLALPVDLANGKATFADPNQANIISEGAAATRIFDGGLTDNTGVLSNIQQWQTDNPNEDFIVNAFINSTATVDLGSSNHSDQPGKVAVDFAKLFGEDGTKASDSLIQNFPLSLDGGASENTPSIAAVYPLVFENSVWSDPQQNAPVWDYQISDDFGIAYYQLDVTTVDNPAWGIAAGSKGILNAFTTYNKNSAAGPTADNAWSEYKKNYDLITDGILNQGGYEHLLKALGVLDFEVDSEKGMISFKGEDNFHADYTLNIEKLTNSSTDEHFSCDVYSYSGSGDKLFLGTAGSSQAENGFNFDDAYDFFRFEQGTSIGFELRQKGADQPVPTEVSIEIDETAYTISLVDAMTNETAMIITAGFATSFDELDSISFRDSTLRADSADSYLSLDAGSQWAIEATSAAAFTNQFSILKVEIDPVSGLLMIDGHLEDTKEFDTAAREAFAADSIFQHTTLKPFSVTPLTFTPQENGLYAPALLTEEGNLYVGEHDLLANHSHSRMMGSLLFGFEDMAGKVGDWDHNDAVIQFIPQTTSI